MDHITQMITHCSKVNLDCVYHCTKFHQNQTNGLIFETNCSSIRQRFMKLGDGLLRKRGKNKHTFPIFVNDFLSSSNQMELKSSNYIFPIKQDDICVCFMSSGMMLDSIIINTFTQSTKKSTAAHQEHLFFRLKDDVIQLYKWIYAGLHTENTNCQYKKNTAFSSLHQN